MTSEKLIENLGPKSESVKEQEPDFEAFFTRHGVALYKQHEEILRSENPEALIDYSKAPTPELDPEHLESARSAAETLIGSFDAEHDELFIVSSNVPRAIETADIYRQVAHDHKFTVTNHEKQAKNEYANSLAGKEIRILNNLKVGVENLVTLSVFHPSLEGKDINWEHVNEDTKGNWEEARRIIESDNKANWGENFVAHADKICKLYPDVGRAKASYERQFQNLLKLARFAATRSNGTAGGKKVKVLAFGHENYILPFLNEYFGDSELNNVETIKLEVGDELSVERRGEERIV